MTRILMLAALLLATWATPALALRLAVFNVKWLTATAAESRMAPWKTEAELSAHRRALAEILARDVRADIVCILEVTSRAALDKLAAEPALRKLGYRALHLESGDTGTGQDVAFLVRVPVEKIDGAEIRRFADTLRAPAKAARAATRDKRPAAQHEGGEKSEEKNARKAGRKNTKVVSARLTKHAVVCVSAPEKICVMGLHLLAHPDDARRTKRREIQARIAADLVRAEIAARGYRAVVLGDFNDFDPDVEGISGTPDKKRKVLRLVKDYDPARPGPELFNLADRLPLARRYSAYWDKNRNARLDESDPLSLIDHILVDKALAPRVRSFDILHRAHDGSVSDHWPLVVEFR